MIELIGAMDAKCCRRMSKTKLSGRELDEAVEFAKLNICNLLIGMAARKGATYVQVPDDYITEDVRDYLNELGFDTVGLRDKVQISWELTNEERANDQRSY